MQTIRVLLLLLLLLLLSCRCKHWVLNSRAHLNTIIMGGGSANWVIVHWNILEAGLEARSFTPTPPPPSFSWTREEPYLYRVVYTWVLMDSKSIYVKSIQFKALLFLGECWGGGEWVPFAKDHEKSAKQVNWYAWYAILAILIICENFFMGYLIANDILNEAVLWPSWHA